MAAPFGSKTSNISGETPGFASMIQAEQAAGGVAGARAYDSLVSGAQKHPDYLAAALQAASANMLTRPNHADAGPTAFAIGLLAIHASGTER